MAKHKGHKAKLPKAKATRAKSTKVKAPKANAVKAKEAKAKATKAVAAEAKPRPTRLEQVCGPYVFQNRKTLRLADLLKLDPKRQQQFVLQSQSYMGTSERTVTACVAEITKYDGCSIDEYSIDLWEIATVGEAEPIFEYWVSGAGDGEVFWAGEARPTAVQSVQREFASLELDEASHALAAALQQVAPG